LEFCTGTILNERPNDLSEQTCIRELIEPPARAMKAIAHPLRLKKLNAIVRETICGIEKRK